MGSDSDKGEKSEVLCDNKYPSAATSIKSRHEKLQIIDTTLLKCYLQVFGWALRELDYILKHS